MNLTARFGLVLLMLELGAAAHGAAPAAVPLWPGTPPGDTPPAGEEKDLTKPQDDRVAGRRLIRLGNVSTPTLTVYAPPRSKANGAAVLVCPGGGYHILAMDLEGTEVATWLNSIGVTAVVLKYRVPVRKDRPRYEAPLQDAQRAMGIVRHRAAEWRIDPGRVGILGFSAGGHLAAVTSTRENTRSYAAVDDADREPCRPDFAVLVYPAYLTLEKEGDRVAPELTVNAKTPPTFIVQTQDDVVRVESGLFYSLALKNAKVPVELHVFPVGGHGYGLRPTELAVTHWPGLAADWMQHRGLLTRTGKQ